MTVHTPKKRMSRGRILSIAASKESFRVSWRYHDDALRRRCREMEQEGLLRRVPGKPEAAFWEITDIGRAAIEGAQ